jgi:hypothetical protein
MYSCCGNIYGIIISFDRKCAASNSALLVLCYQFCCALWDRYDILCIPKIYIVQGMRCDCEEEALLRIGQVARQKEFVGVLLLDFAVYIYFQEMNCVHWLCSRLRRIGILMKAFWYCRQLPGLCSYSDLCTVEGWIPGGSADFVFSIVLVTGPGAQIASSALNTGDFVGVPCGAASQ